MELDKQTRVFSIAGAGTPYANAQEVFPKRVEATRANNYGLHGVDTNEVINRADARGVRVHDGIDFRTGKDEFVLSGSYESLALQLEKKLNQGGLTIVVS